MKKFAVWNTAALGSAWIISTSNCTERQARRLWKKFLKKHLNYPSGNFVVVYLMGTFTVKPLFE